MVVFFSKKNDRRRECEDRQMKWTMAWTSDLEPISIQTNLSAYLRVSFLISTQTCSHPSHHHRASAIIIVAPSRSCCRRSTRLLHILVRKTLASRLLLATRRRSSNGSQQPSAICVGALLRSLSLKVVDRHLHTLALTHVGNVFLSDAWISDCFVKKPRADNAASISAHSILYLVPRRGEGVHP